MSAVTICHIERNNTAYSEIWRFPHNHHSIRGTRAISDLPKSGCVPHANWAGGFVRAKLNALYDRPFFSRFVLKYREAPVALRFAWISLYLKTPTKIYLRKNIFITNHSREGTERNRWKREYRSCQKTARKPLSEPVMWPSHIRRVTSNQMKLNIFRIYIFLLQSNAQRAKKWGSNVVPALPLPGYYDLSIWWKQFLCFHFTSLLHLQSIPQD